LYGIGPRCCAFRGDEAAIGRALLEDARGLRNAVYFPFVLTVDNRTADRFGCFDGRGGAVGATGALRGFALSAVSETQM
jgi:hypothetical protein